MKKKQRLEDIIYSVDKTLESIEEGTKMGKKNMFRGFDMSEIKKYQKKYADEAKEKYSKDIVEEPKKERQNIPKSTGKR